MWDPKTIAHYAGVIGRCKTLLWNGPLGAFEVAPFGEGTFALAREAAALTKAGKLMSVAGGGDTVAALNAAGVTGRFHLRLDRWRRLPRMARGPHLARNCRAGASALNRVHSELTPNRTRRAGQRRQGHGLIVGV